MGRKPKTYRCKIGTMPGLIILWRKYKLVPGAQIKFRQRAYSPWGSYWEKWSWGRIDRVNDFGEPFITLLYPAAPGGKDG